MSSLSDKVSEFIDWRHRDYDEAVELLDLIEAMERVKRSPMRITIQVRLNGVVTSRPVEVWSNDGDNLIIHQLVELTFTQGTIPSIVRDYS
jgi:hypothetical protein